MILVAHVICDRRFVAHTHTLAAFALSALMNAPVMLSTSLRRSFTLAPSGLSVSAM